MSTPFARYMPHTATYWAPGANDGFGGVGFAPPILLTCRWQDDAVLFRDAEAREVVSSSVVYPDQPLELRGYLALGDFVVAVDPATVISAKEIRQVAVSPDLFDTETLNKVWL